MVLSQSILLLRFSLRPLASPAGRALGGCWAGVPQGGVWGLIPQHQLRTHTSPDQASRCDDVGYMCTGVFTGSFNSSHFKYVYPSIILPTVLIWGEFKDHNFVKNHISIFLWKLYAEQSYWTQLLGGVGPPKIIVVAYNIALLLVEFHPRILLRHRFKSLHIRGFPMI